MPNQPTSSNGVIPILEGVRLPSIIRPSSTTVAWLVIGLGVVLRIREYLFNRSLWLDEAFLTLNIINRGYTGLTQTLDYNQQAPIGYLWIEKTMVLLFGSSELSLRFFALVSSIIALLLFYRVASYFLKSPWQTIALAFFAILELPLYYAAEVKPYATDLMVCLATYVVFFELTRKGAISTKKFLLLAAFGSIATWFSFASLFVLAACALVSLAEAILHKRTSQFITLSIAFGVWLVSFLCQYVFFLRTSMNQKVFLDDWAFALAPSPSSGDFLSWVSSALWQLFSQVLHLHTVFGLVFASLYLVGLWLLAKRDRIRFGFLFLPLLLALVAAVLHKYLFYDRLILFLTPSVVIGGSIGFAALFSKTKPKGFIMYLVFGLLIGLFFHPTSQTLQTFIHPIEREEMRPVLGYLEKHQKPADTIYVYYGAEPAFRYYAPRFQLTDLPITYGIGRTPNTESYITDLNRVADKHRVWLVFSHVYDWANLNEGSVYLDYAQRHGKLLDSFQVEGASTFLFDLSQPAP